MEKLLESVARNDKNPYGEQLKAVVDGKVYY